MPSRLSICIFSSQKLACSVGLLKSDYSVHQVRSLAELIEWIEEEPIDCLITAEQPSTSSLFKQLYERGVLLPAIIVGKHEQLPSQPQASADGAFPPPPNTLYHRAEVWLSLAQIDELPAYVEQAIAQFLHLGARCPLPNGASTATTSDNQVQLPSALRSQQQRLAQKLQSKLGYFPADYLRKPQNFYRHLSASEQQALLEQLNSQYCQIILGYFSKNSKTNYQIDDFVEQAFLADLSTSQIIELHMELMDTFAQQLKLEGRSEEILLDYRLTLIEVISHLSEVYRRSIPPARLENMARNSTDFNRLCNE